MRRNVVIALAVAAVALVAGVIVACNSGPSCKPGTFALQVVLDGTANLADTITVSSQTPGAMVTQSVPHTPNGDSVFTITVSWPNGYPADKLVTLLVRATGGVTTLGEAAVSIHLDPTCSTGSVAVTSTLIPDGGAQD